MIGRLYILTEAGGTYGYGHVIRCNELYKKAYRKSDLELVFLVEGVEFSNGIISEEYIEKFNWKRIEFIEKYITEKDYVIIDSYNTSEELYHEIALRAKKVIYIDDYNRINYPRGIVVNPSLYGKKLDYKYDSLKHYLSGDEYIILRNEFYYESRNNINDEVKNILITFGGSDILNLTPLILKKVNEISPNSKKMVVITDNFKNYEKILDYKNENTTILKNITASKMCRLMLDADIAISAGGQTIYELIKTSTPSIIFEVSYNQKYNIKALEDLGTILKSDIDLFEENFKLIENYDVRESFFKNCNKVNIKNGAENIIFSLLTPELKLRKAEKKDIDYVYELSNEKIVRENSLNTQSIEFQNHIVWFNEKINCKNFKFYIIYNDNDNFLGQMRFEINNDEATVSISLAEKIRGKNNGTYVLELGKQALLEENIDIKKLISYVKETNISSSKLFKKYGFIEVENKDNIIKYIYDIK